MRLILTLLLAAANISSQLTAGNVFSSKKQKALPVQKTRKLVLSEIQDFVAQENVQNKKCRICCDTMEQLNLTPHIWKCPKGYPHHILMHPDCIQQWRNTQFDAPCPLCKAEQTAREAVSTLDYQVPLHILITSSANIALLISTLLARQGLINNKIGQLNVTESFCLISGITLFLTATSIFHHFFHDFYPCDIDDEIWNSIGR